MSAKEIFLRAVEEFEPAEWPVFLAGACGDDAELRQEVEELLNAHRQQDSLFDVAPTEAVRQIAQPHENIGRYKLLQKIGEGGFGVVYMAEQVRPVRRNVALKIIKPGMDSKEVIARFEAERQALAMMDHPNIAKVFDGGQTESGHPYFVMELVRGIPLTKFCDENKLNTRRRLQLFKEVCNAIQHAHQKGVIHRDIKPSNVMVTLHDGQPVPKVIDFGVSKAISQQLTAKTLFTAYGQMVGTPQYMSPEQAELSGLDIDTRSDIYSLGVLLYELLTGTTPLDPEKLRHTAYAELQRIIREDEPPKPSKRLSTMGDQTAKVASNRDSDVKSLCSTVQGELDWIVMKALDKDRNRRYDTAKGFALDIERYMRGDAVSACPPSKSYLLSKLYRRHRKSLTLAALLFATMLLGLMGTIYGFRQEQLSRRAADAANETAQDARITTQAALANEQATRRDLERQRYNDLINLGFDALRLGDLVRLDSIIETVSPMASDPQIELRLLQSLRESARPIEKPLTLEAPVTSVAVGSNSDILAIGLTTGQVKLREAGASTLEDLEPANDRLLDADYLRHRGKVLLSDDDQYLISACSNLEQNERITNVVRIRQLPLRAVVGEITHDAAIMSIAISGDARYGASGDLKGTIRVWSFPSGEVLWTKANQQPVGSNCLTFSPDSSSIAFAGLEGKVRILNAVDGSESIATQVGPAVQSILYSPDGRQLVIAGGGEVRFWRIGESGLIATSQFVPCAAWDIAFSPNGDLLAITSSDANVRIMDVDAWTELGRFSFLHAGTSVAFDKSNNSIAVGALDGNVYSWPLKRLKQDAIRGVSHFVLPLCIAEDGIVVTAHDTENRVVIWNSRRQQESEALYEHSSRIHCVAISPNGHVLVSGDDEGRVKVFDRSSNSELTSWLHAGRVSDVSFSRDGSRIASAGYDGRVVVYNLEDQAETNLKHSGFATAVAFSPDGFSLATGGGTYWSYGETKIWDLARKEPNLINVDRHPNVVVRLVYSKDGQYLAGTHDYVAGVVRVWDMPQFKKRFDMKAHNGMVSAIDFLPAELRMVTAGDDEGTLKFWDTTDGTQLGAYTTREQVRSVRCALDGNSIVTASKTGIVRIYNARPK